MSVDSLAPTEDEAEAPSTSGNDKPQEPDVDVATTDEAPAGNEPAEPAPAPAKRGKAKGSSARKTRTVELTLTVTGTADGEWQAELKHGSKWIARGIAIPASAVSKAAKELHDDISTPIDEVINAAKEHQQAKVAQLEAELEQAKQTLAELES